VLKKKQQFKLDIFFELGEIPMKSNDFFFGIAVAK